MRNSLKLLEGLGAVEVEWQTSDSVTFSDTKATPTDSEVAESPSCKTVSVESGLTALGFHLATLPVDPRVGKMMIYGALFQCTDPALTIAASMSARSPFVSPFDKRDEADVARKEFAMEGSDHLTTLNAFNTWKEMRRTKGEKATQAFLRESFLSRLTLFQMEDLRRQFSDLLKDVGFLPRDFRLMGGSGRNARETNSRRPETPRSAADAYSDNTALIKAILCAGLYPNIIVAPRPFVRADGGISDKQAGECAFQSLKGEVYLHPSTISFSEKRLDSRYCCYHEIVRTSKTYVRDCTTVSEFALLLFGGSLKVYHTHGVVTVDDWLKFRISPKAAALVKHLRAQMESMLLKKIVSPAEDITGSDEAKALIQAVSTLFACEVNSVPEQSGADIVRPWTGNPENDRRGNDRKSNGGRGSSRGGRGSRECESGRGRGRGRSR
jgi:HrpA-like RNA helicase